MAEAKPVVWREAGSTFYADADGRVVALLYRADAAPGLTTNGEPVVADGGWFLVLGDEPQSHNQVEVVVDPDTEILRPAESREEALDSASELIAVALNDGELR